VLIGAHVSVSGGYGSAVDYAVSVGAECAQIFAKSPRQWKGPAIHAETAAGFVEARQGAGFGPVFTHAAYLLNLATHDDVQWERSVDALVDELARAAVLSADGVVTHVGSDKLQDPPWAAGRIAEAVSRAFERCDDLGLRTRLLLENTAGAGNSFGSTFEQLGDVIARTGLAAESLGICVDTCHAHAFGIALDSREAWEEALDSIAEHVGLHRLGLIHANDCMFALGSRRDRHAWIGDGTIGRGGFSAMFSAIRGRSELEALCAITEMPGEAPHKDEENLRRLRELRFGLLF
jgi:deoxyribonuclease IV